MSRRFKASSKLKFFNYERPYLNTEKTYFISFGTDKGEAYFKYLNSILLYSTLILLRFFLLFINFIKILCILLISRLKNYIDNQVGASPWLALCYPLYGIGSSIDGSPRASLPRSLWISLLS